MTDAFGPDPLDEVPSKAAEAAGALRALKGPAEEAASAIETAFGRAGESLTRSLARAAADGEISLSELARAVLGAVNAGLGSGRGASLGDAVSAALGGLFSGARADGGPVRAGGAYLVGERGPEVFRPASGGVIEPAGGGGGGVSVTLNLQGADPRALMRSEAQIAQALARATLLGARRL